MATAQFMDAADFDQKLLGIELHYTKPVSEGLKPRTTVRISYGPARRAIALITPPMVADWPLLGPEGNWGSKFGPDSPEKAAFQLGLADRALEGVDPQRVERFFEVLRLIDERVCDFVFANQRDLLNTRDLSLEAVRGKMSATVKQRYDGDVPSYKRVAVAVKCFDWNGNRRELPQLDAQRQPLADGVEIRHEDVVMAAVQLDMFYAMSSVFGIKWAPVQLMLLRKRTEAGGGATADIWAGAQIPQWATAVAPPAPLKPAHAFQAGRCFDGNATVYEGSSFH
jgi:hypothetical protein